VRRYGGWGAPDLQKIFIYAELQCLQIIIKNT